MKITYLLNSFLVLALLLGIAPTARTIEPLNTLNGLGNAIESRDRSRDVFGDLMSAAIQSLTQNVELVGYIGGSSYAVAVQGDYAYISIGYALTVVDISTPDNPTCVGAVILPTIIRDVVVAADYAYAIYEGDKGGLQIVDISDPTNPIKIGSYNTPDGPEEVAVAGDYAYVASGYGGLRIIDVSDPFNPTEVGFFNIETPPYDPKWYAAGVSVVGDHAYIASGYGGLRIVDISIPADPVQVGSYKWSGVVYIEHVTVANGYAYVPKGWDGLGVIDISDPTNPIEVGVYDVESESITLVDNYAYVATWFFGLRILDISDPANPVEVGVFDLPDYVEDVVVEGDYAYVAVRDNGLRILNVSDLANPSQVGDYGSSGIPSIVELTDDYAYVAVWKGLRIFDISDPIHITETGFCDLPSYVSDMVVAGGYVYATNVGNDDLYVIDVSDPYSLTTTSSISVPNAYQVAADGDRVYVGGGSGYGGWGSEPYGAFSVLDVSNPIAPTLVSTYTLVGSYEDMAVAGDYVYISTDLDGTGGNHDLWVFDVSDPLNPVPVGQYGTYEVVHIAVKDRYAYLATRGMGVRIVDISDPLNLTEVGFYNAPGDPLDVAVEGDYAYVADGGLRVVNISEPANPSEIGAYEEVFGIGDVAATDSYICVIAETSYSSGGLFILRAVGAVSGRVTDINGTPFPDVTVLVGSNYSATTSVTGAYSLASLPIDTYTLTPTLSGYAFWPPTRTITVPPDANGQDFTVLPAPISTTLTPGITATLTYTDVQGLPTHLTFPTDTITQTTTIVLTPTLVSDSPGFAFAGHAFDLAAYQNGSTQLGHFGAPVTITIHYSDEDVAVVTDENELALRWWDGIAWVDAATTCEMTSSIYHRDGDDNGLSVSICRLGRYALFGPTHQVFLPLILRN